MNPRSTDCKADAQTTMPLCRQEVIERRKAFAAAHRIDEDRQP